MWYFYCYDLTNSFKERYVLNEKQRSTTKYFPVIIPTLFKFYRILYKIIASFPEKKYFFY